ncbi:MAG: C45 family autoproteolytic acyltransferase/hydrolase [Bacteroidetes bacterium]|nr:C45 family autoproteolytic acyltransferase/hydrolase [Bacteroidota bacterium]
MKLFNKNRFFFTTLVLVICSAPLEQVFATGRDTMNKIFREGAVTIEDKGPYYLVTLDYTRESDPWKMGEMYGRCILKAEPDYESIVGYYMFEIATLEGLWGKTVPEHLNAIRPQLPAFYNNELAGIASVMKGSWTWSNEEIVYCFNLLPDLFRTTKCSAFGCWGDASVNRKNVAYRTLDWFGGLFAKELPLIQSVTRIRYRDKTIYLIGALGHLGCITGINLNSGIMAGILDSDVSGTTYDPQGCRSYNFDLRKALEDCSGTMKLASELTSTSKKYAFSHLIVLADEKQTCILENNISGQGAHPVRALRYDTSHLNQGVKWNYPHIIGAVNCFMLKGQVDNFSQGKYKKINERRWSLLLEQLKTRLAAGKNKLTPADVQAIMCSYYGEGPGSLLLNDGDLYNLQTQQMMIYIPAERSLKAFIKPKKGANPADPSPFFYTIPLEP